MPVAIHLDRRLLSHMCYTSLSSNAWIASIVLSSDAEGYSSEHTIAICKAIMIVDGNLSLFSAQQMVN